MAIWLKQSTAVEIKMGPFLDSLDGNTQETRLSITQPDIRLAKNGAAWAQKNAAQTLSHEEAGWYEVALDTTDTNTLGVLIVSIHKTGALAVWREFLVVSAGVYDAFLSTGTLVADVTGNVIEPGFTLQQVLRLIAATTVAKSSGEPNPTFRNLGDSANRVQSTIDQNGNRTAVVVTP